jgi:hypothetical protein
MRYSNPIILLKYLRYYWVAANSKGHGVHSPFVFKFIEAQLNSSCSVEDIVDKSPSIKKLAREIDTATTHAMPKKIKDLIVRLLDKFKPANTCVIANSISISACTDQKNIDFVFFGAGLSFETIQQQTDFILERLHADSWMMMEGIYSSTEMEAAWKMLKKHPKVRLSIDLFFIGLLFCRKEQKEQEHFILRY